MDTDVISRLLNYLITHIITGIIVLILIGATLLSVWGIDIYSLATTLDTWFVWLAGALIVFTLGDIVDAASLSFLDYFLLKKKYIHRPSEIDITSDQIIQLAIACNFLPAEIDKDTAKQMLRDIIPSLFSSSAPSYVQSKREDIDSLYQYHSNMLLILIIGLPLLPIILYNHLSVFVILTITLMLLVLILIFYRFVNNGLIRVFSLEDRFFFGYLLEHAQVLNQNNNQESAKDINKEGKTSKLLRSGKKSSKSVKNR